MKPASLNYLPTLDGWRAVAILGVMICHFTDAIFNAAGTYPNVRWHSLTRNGALGVDVFFGISGFLICTRLLQEHQKSGKISLTGFYIRRAFRILPPYLLYLWVIGLLGLAGVLTVSKWEWISCLLFFRNYLSPSSLGGWYTGHFWSLSVEEHFYFLWPGLLVLCGIRRARWVVVLLALLIAGWRVIEFRQQWIPRLLPEVGFFVRTDVRLDGLLWGCALALFISVPVWKQRLTRMLTTEVWLLLVVLFTACVLYQPPLAMLWQALLIPLMLAGTVLRPEGIMGKLLESGPMRWIGSISYSLYLWQQLFFVGGDEPRPLPMGALQGWPGNMLLVFVCAAASYYLIERRMIKIGYRLSSRLVGGEVTEGNMAIVPTHI